MFSHNRYACRRVATMGTAVGDVVVLGLTSQAIAYRAFGTGNVLRLWIEILNTWTARCRLAALPTLALVALGVGNRHDGYEPRVIKHWPKIFKPAAEARPSLQAQRSMQPMPI